MNGLDAVGADYPPEQERQFFYGKYRGIVSAVDTASWRIKAKVPAVLGDADTSWCTPCVPYAGPGAGIAFLPAKDSGVWIEFEGGDVSYPVWAGCYWRDGERPPDATPDVKVIVTSGQLKLILNDADKSITITDPNGNKVTLNTSGIALVKGGQQILISSASVSVNGGALEVE